MLAWLFFATAGPVAAADIDVQHYDLRLAFDTGTETLSGTATVTATARRDGVSSVALDLVGLTVDQVRVDGAPAAAYTYDGQTIAVSLTAPLATADAVELAVTYHGMPKLDADGRGLTISPSVIWSFAEPDGARRWFPCVDDPVDKATLYFESTVPSTFLVAGNGNQVRGPIDHGDGSATFFWQEDHPIATYLIAIAAAAYSVWTDAAGPVSITYFAYPADEPLARACWAQTPSIVQAFTDVFGPYPFETYGMAETPIWGAMENQTMSMMGQTTLRNNPETTAMFVAHELAHQWWGDSVTPAGWQDIWLNEGFATYAEALWQEWAANHGLVTGVDGQRALFSYIENIHHRYLSYTRLATTEALYAPAALFGKTVYDKGGLVLHMLRFVLGDDAFFATLATYASHFGGGNVTTADFQAVAEETYGQPLAWFFDEWVYGAGVPSIVWGWQEIDGVDGHGVALMATQLQHTGLFTMPVEVELDVDNQPQRQIVWLTPDGVMPDTLAVSGTVNAVRFDPDGWLLAYDGETPPGPPDVDEGCACTSTADTATWAWALVLLALARRRQSLAFATVHGR